MKKINYLLILLILSSCLNIYGQKPCLIGSIKEKNGAYYTKNISFRKPDEKNWKLNQRSCFIENNFKLNSILLGIFNNDARNKGHTTRVAWTLTDYKKTNIQEKEINSYLQGMANFLKKEKETTRLKIIKNDNKFVTYKNMSCFDYYQKIKDLNAPNKPKNEKYLILEQYGRVCLNKRNKLIVTLVYSERYPKYMEKDMDVIKNLNKFYNNIEYYKKNETNKS